MRLQQELNAQNTKHKKVKEEQWLAQTQKAPP